MGGPFAATVRRGDAARIVMSGSLNELDEHSVQEENPNAKALPARESQGANAGNFLQAGNR